MAEETPQSPPQPQLQQEPSKQPPPIAYSQPHAENTPARSEKPGAPVCDGCLKWQWFGRSCWVYWEGKRCCSQFEDDFGENKGGFRLIKEDELFHL